ncbi:MULTISPECIES: hypothetical protein [Rhodopseudomonas]|uniref:Uncharacterized protein n=1 Tax=Rhodopseudomonas palustris TaxID=1076 RepID=A0A0D7F2U9_RHOPL|nr:MULTISPECIES: hypothetical protein [Rhodopseudomonas]KIZ47413.1 hypothetical protein OO17_04485 [Rhodopseudomonas palustris]MDF3812760.1 hypothetical protein [Rhodopseudomonas sp. BAL398]WOK20353.1 hypothetical protein RBJ75_12895 [Rhodopseudomonas sp. BAL398]
MRRWSLLIAILLGSLLPQCLALGGELERGAAIVDPLALREFDISDHRTGAATHPGFGLRQMLDAAGPSPPLHNDRLFALPAMTLLRPEIDAEFDRYLDSHKRAAAPQRIGVGPSFDVQLFDRDKLYSAASRFVLAGIVNRMDRRYVAPTGCGDIRLIYRLVAEEKAGAQRLPMTLNLVLKARGDHSGLACAEIARRWLETGTSQLTGAELAAQLIAPDGALGSTIPADIDRIEINLQIAHRPKSPTADFRTDYLLKVFRRDPVSGIFTPSPLENQIDRGQLIANRDLGLEFKRWLLEPDHLRDLDRGTIVIPEKFLARFAIAATPVGFARSDLQPAYGLVAPAAHPLFGEAELVRALRRAADNGIALQNINSPAGFERRLNDITCSGCHQIRGIGGFHFPGVDATKPGTLSGAVPGSPLFVGDQPRRRDILTALREGEPPDYSRGFSDRPQLRGATALLGSEYVDGWGAHCYLAGRDGGKPDPSFQSWTCAEGLVCQAVDKHAASRIGMCFVANP